MCMLSLVIPAEPPPPAPPPVKRGLFGRSSAPAASQQQQQQPQHHAAANGATPSYLSTPSRPVLQKPTGRAGPRLPYQPPSLPTMQAPPPPGALVLGPQQLQAPRTQPPISISQLVREGPPAVLSRPSAQAQQAMELHMHGSGAMPHAAAMALQAAQQQQQFQQIAQMQAAAQGPSPFVPPQAPSGSDGGAVAAVSAAGVSQQGARAQAGRSTEDDMFRWVTPAFA